MDYQLQIKKYRTLRGMTQAELASKANIKQSYISQLERNSAKAKSPTLRVIFKIAEALNVCPHILVKYNTYCSRDCCHDCEQFFK